MASDWLSKLKSLIFEESGQTETESSSKLADTKTKPLPEELSEIDFKQIIPKLSKLLKEDYTYYFALIPVLLFAFWIRIQNLDLLKGQFLLGLDPYKYFRYAAEILANGHQPAIDMLRRAPIGTVPQIDAFPYFMAAWDKLVMSFGQTQMFAHIISPAVFGIIGFIFFFLFVKELFNPKVALVATAFLAVIPAYLYRTLSGFADHEALSMIFMFAALWTFVLAFKDEKTKKKYLFSISSGLFSFGMIVVWSGASFLTVPIAAFAVLVLLFNRATKQFTFIYSIWALLFILPFVILEGIGAISNIGVVIPIFALLALWINIYYPKFKASNYLQKYFSKSQQSILITVIFGLILNFFLKIVNFSSLSAQIAQPAEASGRVAHTISEITGSTNLYSQFSLFLIFGVLAVIYLIYLTFNDWKKTAIFSIPILIFLIPAFFKHYPLSTYLNLLILLIVVVIIEYLYFYYKKGQKFFDNITPIYFIPLIFVIFTTYLAKSAARFLFNFSPIITVLAALFIVTLAVKAFERPEIISKLAGVILIILIAFLVFSNAQITAQQAEYSGSGLPGAWNNAFTWIRENTPEEAIITHWWDYGYWTQTVGERASTHDGGTHGEYPLYILGRYGMTAQTPEGALTFFKTYKVNYLLFSEEEIGKYHAFSYIGSDKDMDRYSTIGVYALQQEQEVRDGTKLIYGGQWGFDKNIIINTKVYQEGRAAIVGFTIDRQENDMLNPIAYISDGGSSPAPYPISCICMNGRCMESEAKSGIGGCIVIMPSISSPTDANEIGAALYLSDKVKDGLFARLYIKKEKLDGFEEVYNDGIPLALYQGRIIGPKIIWKVTPPSYIKEDPILLWNNTAVYGYEKDFRKNFEK